MPRDADLENIEVSCQSCPSQQLVTAHLPAMSAAVRAPLLLAHVWQSSSKLTATAFSHSLGFVRLPTACSPSPQFAVPHQLLHGPCRQSLRMG